MSVAAGCSFFLVGILLPIRCATISTTRTNDYASVTFCAAANCPELYGPSCSSPCGCGNASCFSGASGNGSCLIRKPILLINCGLFESSYLSFFFRNPAAFCFAGSDASASWPYTQLVPQPFSTAPLAISDLTRLLFANGMESAAIGIRTHVRRSTARLARPIR